MSRYGNCKCILHEEVRNFLKVHVKVTVHQIWKEAKRLRETYPHLDLDTVWKRAMINLTPVPEVSKVSNEVKQTVSV